MKTLREHFSWSQYNLWKSSKKSYRDKYVLGLDDRNNEYMKKGKELANTLESGIIIGNNVLDDAIVLALPKLDKQEKELYVLMDDFNILAYLDSAKSDLSLFYEYKTGKTIWDDDRVQDDEQILFYATLIYELKGVIPLCHLYWAETYKNENTGEIEFTGTIKKFVRAFDEREIKKMRNDIISTRKEISEYEHNVTLINDDIVEQYVKIKQDIDNLNEKANTLKDIIMDEMGDMQYGESSYGTFTVVNRKSYVYGEHIVKLEKEYKDIINKMKRDERKGDIEEKVTSTYLKFKQY